MIGHMAIERAKWRRCREETDGLQERPNAIQRSHGAYLWVQLLACSAVPNDQPSQLLRAWVALPPMAPNPKQ